VIALTAQGERRHLTVMFCDLVESTPLAERLDPEELAEVYAIWQDACAEAIAEHGGHISDYRGDSVLVFFGYPTAYEDGAHRAIRTALDMLRRLVSVNVQLQKLHNTTLAVRIGIHAGLVLLSDLGGRFIRDQFALGETPNIAARLQALAAPDQILISGAVRSLVRGYFSFEDVGEHTLKGVSRAVSACRVVAETDARDRMQAASERGLTSFVARESEIAELRRRWTLSAAGHGQAVMLIGEAGIGKSRLIEAIGAFAQADNAQRVVFRCSPYHSASALHPVVEHMRRFLGIERDETAAASIAKLERSLKETGSPDPLRDAGLIGALLELPVAETPFMRAFAPHQRRAQALDAMVAWAIRSAGRRALLLVVEDIHWADASTIDFLGLLLATIGEAPIGVVMTTRPESHALFPDRPELGRLTIGRLSDADAENLIDHALQDRSVPDDLRREIIARADGVPLFIEELVAMIAESGYLREAGGHYAAEQPLATLSIPLTLQDLLAARLDRHAEARDTAQLAAVLGREFSLNLIDAVSSVEEPVLRASLEKLVDSELIQQGGAGRDIVYRFKHALIRDAAYQSMLKGRRQRYHRVIATALEKGIPGIVEPPPEILAHHFTEAGLIDEAIRHWLAAGERALRRSANVEALHHLDRGVALLKSRDAGPARDREELSLQLPRGAALLMVKGQSAPEVHACFARAQELSQGLEDSPELFTALLGLCRIHIVRGSLPPAREIAEQLVGIAGRLGDPALRLAANTMLSLVLYHLCELPKAMALAEKGITEFDALPPQSRLAPIFNLGQHPAVACCFCASFIATLWGDLDAALAHRARGAAFAESTGMSFQIANAEGWSMMLAILRRDGDSALDCADRLLALAHEQVFPQWEFAGNFHRGVLLVEIGRHAEGLALARAGIAAGDSLGSQNTRVRVRALFAQACGVAGRVEEGLEWLAEAYSSQNQFGEQWWEPELHRIEGRLRLSGANADAAAAERCFRQAMAIAQARGLPLFALRAATSLARLLDAAQRRDEAREALGLVLAAFAKGVEMRDFQEAQAVFDRLSS
jgi:class 3 adenylate cyclase